MNTHRIHRYMSSDGYTAACRCGWRVTHRSHDARETAAAEHLATTEQPRENTP